MMDRDQADAGQDTAIAVIGMAGRFPRAADVEAFWRNLREGVHAVTFFSDDELRAAGVDPARRHDKDFVGAGGVLEGADLFDAGFFGYTPREAEVMDPQHRVFMETAWEALENAGYDPGSAGGTVGVYAGSSTSYYLFRNVLSNPEVVEAVGTFQAMLGNGKDFLATRAAHRLNLRGPALNVQTGCSTGLVSIHLACQALISGECDVAVAGGVSVSDEQRGGYRYTPGGISSPDGFCRAFDAQAAGTVGGNGIGLVVLKRLTDALEDGDTIRAVVRGSAINNDGSRKVGFTAPSVDGQAAVIQEALAVGGVDPATVGYVEAHGSGTELGDPVEVSALTRAFGAAPPRQSVALGSVKASIGHLDAASGAAGFIKTVLSLENGEIPPSLHYTAPNPRIDFAASPFYVNAALRPWPGDGTAPRRAGVSSFGMGGTNAHVVLEQAPAPRPSVAARPWHLLTLSARTPAALDAATDRLSAHLRAHPEQDLADVAWTLQVGRRAWEHRRVLVARDGERAAAALDARARDRVVTGVAPDTAQDVAFLFPGLGSHYAGMGRGLYETEPVFRATVDRCAEILRPHLGLDIRDVLYPADLPPEQEEEEAATTIDLRAMLGRAAEEERDPGEGLNATKMAQPALFVTEYALAQLWMSWGVRPAAMIGHSLGEYVAATIAGVWSLEDGLRLAAERARLIEAQPPGGMMGVVLPEEEARGLLRDGLCIGALNGPQISVLSGPAAVLDALQAEVAARGMVHRRLPVRHAFHSTMMEPVAEGLAELLRGMELHAPRIPFASNVTGDWIRDEEATDPTYWTRHLCGTVRFSEGVTALAGGGTRVLLEVGPGHALRMLSAQLPVWGDTRPTFVASLRHGYERHPDVAHVLGAAGRLWAAGAPVDWEAVHANERLRRVPVPAYPFERTRYWIERRAGTSPIARGGDPLARREDPAEWLYVPTWNRAAPPAPAAPAEGAEAESWLVLADEAGVGTRLAARLRALGHTVAVARAGDDFARDGDGWTVRPGTADDLERLRTELEGEGVRPRRVVQLWGMDADGPDALDRADTAEAAESFARAHARGYAAVAAVARTFAGERADGPFRLLVATEGVRDVSGSEGVRPERATVLGACLALPHEHPHARCGTVDVRRVPGGEDALAEQLLAEALADGAETSVAFRGRFRYTRGWQAVPPQAGAGPRPGGAWLFAGLPRAGDDVLVEQLAQAPGARIAVVADPGFPERDAWDARLAGAHADDLVATVIRGLRAAEARGARTLLLRADPEDPAALRNAVAEARDAFGELHGVVYTQRLSAGAEHASLAETVPGDVGAAMARVAADLAALEAATAGVALDAVLLQNSNLSVFGGPRLAAPTAAGLLMAAWAARQAARGGAPWTSVDWDRWLPEEDERAPRTPFTERAIVGGEGARVFAHAAALAGEPRVVVSTHDLEARIAQLRAPRGAPARTEEPGDGAQHPRPELRSEYHPPTNPAEEVLVEFWRELTGIREIGIRDDFFALGGNSLLGMQLLSRVRDAFEVDLPLRAVFEAPTVASLAVLIDEAIILELEAMDEDEALVLAGGTAP